MNELVEQNLRNEITVKQENLNRTYWTVNYYGGVKIGLSNTQKEFLIKNLEDGKKYVQIDGQILTGDFSTIVRQCSSNLE